MTPLQRARHRHAMGQYRARISKPEAAVTPWGFVLWLIFAVLAVVGAGILLLRVFGG